MPSPRDIPQVKKLWHELPYDKYIVKYTPELEAYTIARDFFLKHNEYTHFVVCPDDLEVTKEGLETLLNYTKLYPIISGISNIDEDRPYVYAVQPLGCDFTRDHPPSQKWYSDDGDYNGVRMPDKLIIQVGHSGFCCEVISREVMDKVSWVGSSNGGRGHFDWQFSKDCHELGIPIHVHFSVNFWHRRNEQQIKTMLHKNTDENIGYEFWLIDR